MKTAILTLLLPVLLGFSVASPTAAQDAPKDQQAPDKYRVKVETTQGDFVISVDRKLAPFGADRFYSLVKSGFYNDVIFFRAVEGFVVQFGISGDPAQSKIWSDAVIKDDPVKASNTAGTITFATSGPNSRTTQLFINLGDNTRLDELGFAPFGKVTEGFEIVKKLHTGYGEQPSRYQAQIRERGNKFLTEYFPKLDRIKKATVIK